MIFRRALPDQLDGSKNLFLRKQATRTTRALLSAQPDHPYPPPAPPFNRGEGPRTRTTIKGAQTKRGGGYPPLCLVLAFSPAPNCVPPAELTRSPPLRVSLRDMGPLRVTGAARQWDRHIVRTERGTTERERGGEEKRA